jgi:3-oxoadipate enol-lactonase
VAEPIKIVALAGSLCSPDIFGPLTGQLAGTADIDAVSWMTSPGPWDLPTLAVRVAERIIAAGPEPVTLIGHSTGGAIALQLVLDFPELVDSLVLIDTGSNMHSHGDVDAIIDRIRSDWGTELFGAVLDRSFATPLDADVRDNFLKYADVIEQRAAEQVLISQRATDFGPRLSAVGCPVIVIHGQEDRSRSSDQAREFAAAFPDAALHLLPCGHSPMFELPEAVARIIAGR